MRETIKKIDHSKIYSLTEMSQEAFFPWINSGDVRAYRTVVQLDRKAKNILRVFQYGNGKQKRYRVQGANIVKFLEEVETGTYQL